MDVRPSMIGPGFGINPNLVITLLDDVIFPFPGVIVASNEPVMIIGENNDVALGMKHIQNFALQGRTGSTETNIKTRIEAGQLQVVGNFSDNMLNYFIMPDEVGYTIKGQAGKHTFQFRTSYINALFRCVGQLNKEDINFVMDSISSTAFTVRCKIGKKESSIDIFYRDEEIKITGVNEGVYVDYTVKSAGDHIEMMGMTKAGFSKIVFTLESETEFNVTGKPGGMPVDYKLFLYENGVAFKGLVGRYPADYAFVAE